ncbi:MAG: hypothetical protein II891_02815 [Bacteroidales bacterium]|nr:hypothetical protein [Bacteroidales bacterium]
MKKQMPYSMPEGYMQSVQQRLEAIPDRAKGVGSRPAASPWQKVSPYLALAAVFAAAFVIGGTLLKRTIPSSSSEEIAAYYMDSDLTLAQLEDAFFYYED